MAHQTLEAWHQVIAQQDVQGLDTLLAHNAVFHSPVVHTPQRGKPLVKKYLTAAFSVLGHESFRYVREIVDGRHAMLEFTVELDGILVNGIDIITWNDNGRIADFKVMIRPLKAIHLVKDRMMETMQRGLTPID